jgi:hypothetical protein
MPYNTIFLLNTQISAEQIDEVLKVIELSISHFQ